MSHERRVKGLVSFLERERERERETETETDRDREGGREGGREGAYMYCPTEVVSGYGDIL